MAARVSATRQWLPLPPQPPTGEARYYMSCLTSTLTIDRADEQRSEYLQPPPICLALSLRLDVRKRTVGLSQPKGPSLTQVCALNESGIRSKSSLHLKGHLLHIRLQEHKSTRLEPLHELLHKRRLHDTPLTVARLWPWVRELDRDGGEQRSVRPRGRLQRIDAGRSAHVGAPRDKAEIGSSAFSHESLGFLDEWFTDFDTEHIEVRLCRRQIGAEVPLAASQVEMEGLRQLCKCIIRKLWRNIAFAEAPLKGIDMWSDVSLRAQSLTPR